MATEATTPHYGFAVVVPYLERASSLNLSCQRMRGFERRVCQMIAKMKLGRRS